MKTENVALRILIACAIGAGFGTLLADYFDQFWLLGTMLGGLVGYLTYNPREVFSSLVFAYEQIIGFRFMRIVEFLKLTWIYILSEIILLSYGALAITLSGFAITNEWKGVLVAVTLISFFTTLLMVDVFVGMDNRKNIAFVIIKYLNPLVLPFTIIYFIFVGMKYFIINGPELIFKFFKTFFILIHSQARLICFIDSLIGGTIGHFAGNNVLIGICAGAILGIANYYFVSIKWLKLQPKI